MRSGSTFEGSDVARRSVGDHEAKAKTLAPLSSSHAVIVSQSCCSAASTEACSCSVSGSPSSSSSSGRTRRRCFLSGTGPHCAEGVDAVHWAIAHATKALPLSPTEMVASMEPP